jgi:2'-5' RNA ligase
MRLFVAIALPSEAASELDEVVAPLRPARPELRWTGRDAWHLTLAFLGEVEQAIVARLAVRLERAARRHPCLLLSVSGAGAFPGASRARVLWTGIEGDRRELTALAASVGAGARRAGAPPAAGGRGYEPHLTLARCRIPTDVRPLVETLGGFAGTPWVAREIYLIHSRLGAHPRYEVLGSWPLRSAGPGTGQRGGHDGDHRLSEHRSDRQDRVGADERHRGRGGAPGNHHPGPGRGGEHRRNGGATENLEDGRSGEHHGGRAAASRSAGSHFAGSRSAGSHSAAGRSAGSTPRP